LIPCKSVTSLLLFTYLQHESSPYLIRVMVRRREKLWLTLWLQGEPQLLTIVMRLSAFRYKGAEVWADISIGAGYLRRGVCSLNHSGGANTQPTPHSTYPLRLIPTQFKGFRELVSKQSPAHAERNTLTQPAVFSDRRQVFMGKIV